MSWRKLLKENDVRGGRLDSARHVREPASERATIPTPHKLSVLQAYVPTDHSKRHGARMTTCENARSYRDDVDGGKKNCCNMIAVTCMHGGEM